MIIQSSNDWHFAARTLVKNQLTDHDLNYTDLSRRLVKLGVVHPGPLSLKNKINRGTFSAAFLMQVYFALDVRVVDLRGGGGEIV